jgi:hypothetical protein
MPDKYVVIELSILVDGNEPIPGLLDRMTSVILAGAKASGNWPKNFGFSAEPVSVGYFEPEKVSLFNRPRPLRKLVVSYIAKRGGVSEAQADAALASLEDASDQPFLDWILNGGLEKLIELVLKLLPLFI